MRRLLVLAAIGLAAPAGAHVFDVTPVRISIRADGPVLRATLRTNSHTWGFASLAWTEGMPPEEFRRLSEAYLRSHFILSIDGQALAPEVVSARTVRPLWRDDMSEEVILHLRYTLPAEGDAFHVASTFFKEIRDEVEGRGRSIPEGVIRDFRTLLHWGPWVGEKTALTLDRTDFTLARSALARGVFRRWGESAGAGCRAVFLFGGGVALLFSLLLFLPSGRAASIAGGSAILLAATGVFLPWTVQAADRAVALSLVLAGGASIRRWGPGFWSAAAVLGSCATGWAWVGEGAAYRTATAFTEFSWGFFCLGLAACLAGFFALRPLVERLYRWHFGHLTPEELARQNLFHRRMLSRLLAIGGAAWLLSPYWVHP